MLACDHQLLLCLGVSAFDVLQVLALGTVVGTALGCLMFLDRDHVASSAGLRTAAVLLVILNVAFLVLVTWLVFQHGKRHASAFLRQTQVIGKAAFGPLKSAYLRHRAHFHQKPRQNTPSSSSPQADVAMPVRATRAESMQPMLSERMQSGPISSRSSMSLDSSHL